MLLTLLEHLSSPPIFSGIHVAKSLVFCIVFFRSLFVFSLLNIALFVLLQFTATDPLVSCKFFLNLQYLIYGYTFTFLFFIWFIFLSFNSFDILGFSLCIDFNILTFSFGDNWFFLFLFLFFLFNFFQFFFFLYYSLFQSFLLPTT